MSPHHIYLGSVVDLRPGKTTSILAPSEHECDQPHTVPRSFCHLRCCDTSKRNTRAELQMCKASPSLSLHKPRSRVQVPGDACWPSEADFTALNATLGGRLIASVPPASVCYSSHANFDEEKCDGILASWFSSSFHAADPISIDWPWWANNSCPPVFPNGTSVTGDTFA